MTVKERVLASRLVQKIESNSAYAKQIGLSCSMTATGKQNNEPKFNVQKPKQ